jgi:hypothetical protein
MSEDAQHIERTEPQFDRREPTIGAIPDVPQPAARRPQAPPSIEENSRFLNAYALELAPGEGMVDNVEVRDAAGLSEFILTDRRLIVRGREHQTVYPLRNITRLAVVRHTRWWMVALGVGVSGVGAAAALLPAVLFPLSSQAHLYIAGGLFVLGLVLVGIGALRPLHSIEVRTLGGEIRLRLPRKDEALAGFVSSLAQRIR